MPFRLYITTLRRGKSARYCGYSPDVAPFLHLLLDCLSSIRIITTTNEAFILISALSTARLVLSEPAKDFKTAHIALTSPPDVLQLGF